MNLNNLMVQGTTSDAGKSTVVAALCRLLWRQGRAVAPFKPQNMALNSAVTADGGEIGRAQALQAQAAGIAAHTDMNPVLIKPSSDTTAQIIIQGQVRHDMSARDYLSFKQQALPAVLQSFTRLTAQYQHVVVEGAGSPAEVNLRERDIANMGFAEAVDCPVILVADIDRGGVFAHIIGTLACLSESERQRVVGFVINRFRGDLSILQPGLDWLEQQTGKPVLAVLPYLMGLQLDAEDAIQQQQTQRGQFKVVVPIYPRTSNHTDFDVLRAHPELDLQFIGPQQAIPAADLIILPGSKNTRADLQFLRQQGWDQAIYKHLRYGGKLLGICGGYQMLGQSIVDPYGVEGSPGTDQGLALLDIHTELGREKCLRQTQAQCRFDGSGLTVQGYEIHMGRSTLLSPQTAAFEIEGQAEGVLSADQQILGSYLHGWFDQGEAVQAMLRWAGLTQASAVDLPSLREASLNRLADACEPLLQRLQALGLVI